MRASIILKPWIGAVVREIYGLVDAESGALPGQPDEADKAYGEAIGECMKRIEETAASIGVSLDRPDDADKERLAAMVADAAGDAQLGLHDSEPPSTPPASPLIRFIRQAKQLRRVVGHVMTGHASEEENLADLHLVTPHFDEALLALADWTPTPAPSSGERWVEATTREGHTTWVNMARVFQMQVFNDVHAIPYTALYHTPGMNSEENMIAVRERPEHFLPKPRWP